VLVVAAGCSSAKVTRRNSVAVVVEKDKAHHDRLWWIWLKNTYLYRVRDALDPLRLGRTLGFAPCRAMDLDENGDVVVGSFYAGSRIDDLSLDELTRGQSEPGPPVGALSVTGFKNTGTSPGYFCKDERGVGYMVKLDPPGFPELTTSAELIGGRIMWLLGYHVPARYIITARVPTHPEFDGNRAVVIALIEGELLGHMNFRKFRHRRAFRGLRIASAWIDNTDMKDHNTLQVWRDGRMWYYLLDFNGSLGSSSSAPKEPWHGWRSRWDPIGSPVDILTLGLWPQPYDRTEPVRSAAVGRFREHFDPRTWKPSFPNQAFDEMSDEDARWMAGLIAAFTEDRVRAIVKGARYSRKEDEDYVVRVLMARRRRILETYGNGFPRQ